MRSVLELLDLPYTFWQLRPLTEEQFRSEAADRGVVLFPRQMEGLHRLRLLTPFLRVRRDGRSIAAAARRADPFRWEDAHWMPTRRFDLLEARNAGRLHDPVNEHFIARGRLQRGVGDVTYRSSEYLYSHHQLLALPILRAAMPYLSYGATGEVEGFSRVQTPVADSWRAQAEWLHPRLVALSALEPIYYPQIVRRIRYNGDELERYEAWHRDLRPRAMLNWLGVDAAWVKETAGQLLGEADGFDPLGRWSELVREAEPASWEPLEGEARSAVDLRIGAEILLRYYDRLVKGRIAPKIKPPPRRHRDDFSGRLKPQGGLDGTLASFGLSPHPRLVLVVEGETELLVFPRLMELFAVRRDRDFIAIENAQGVGRDLSTLIAYAVAPQTERDEGGRYLRLHRPLTRLLAVMDAEGKYATKRGREERRQAWIDRILRTLPKENRTEAVRESIDRLVAVETWDAKGQSFEFAHFTDRQLALATAQIDRRESLSLHKRIDIAGSIRGSRGKLDPLLGKASKIDLADALWPALQMKIARAEQHGTESRIPVVRVLDRAIELAHELPRHNVVIPLERQK